MAEIILYIATSLDGFIADQDGGIDWLSVVEDEQEDYGYAHFYDSVDALIMGSHTYEQVLGFGDWPYPGKQTYVMSGRQLPCQRDDVMLPGNDIGQVLELIKSQNRQRVWLVGGGEVVSSFHRRKLINEYQLFIVPVILGAGIPLFTGESAMQTLQLKYSHAYPTGLVELHYTHRAD